MDVSLKSTFLFVAICLAISGCSPGSKSSGSQVFNKNQNSDGKCAQKKIENQFIVQWKNGDITIEHGRDADEFESDFIDPQIDAIKHVDYDYRLTIEPIADELFQAKQSGNYVDNWGPDNTLAASAWQQGIYGDGIVVGVTDTGMDYNHVQLADSVALNTKEIADNGIDDDKNGYVDDYYGYSPALNSGDVMDHSTDYNPGHGTHVSGIIAARHLSQDPADTYVHGIAPKAKIVPIKILDDDGSGSAGWAIQGLNYAIVRGVKIINASWGGSICVQALKDKIVELEQRGILFVMAAGNSGRNLDYFPEYPAAFQTSTSITVGAISDSNLRFGPSNFSLNLVQLYAPGDTITSTVPSNGGSNNQNYMALSGTSMAAPFVTGAAALLWSRHPTATAQIIRQAILDSVTVDQEYSNSTHGRLNIEQAVKKIDLLTQ